MYMIVNGHVCRQFSSKISMMIKLHSNLMAVNATRSNPCAAQVGWSMNFKS